MRRYAVIGWPVGHSLSPAMQNAAFKARGIDALYEAVPIEPKEFHTGILRLLDEGFDGWNVTVPHKERMFEACDALGNGDGSGLQRQDDGLLDRCAGSRPCHCPRLRD